MSEQGVVRGLHHNPPIAMRLGIFVAEFANIEMVLPIILSRISNISYEAGEAIINSVESIANRRTIVENALKVSSVSDEEKNHLQKWLSDVKGIITQRNKYVHATYTVNLYSMQVSMHTYMYSNQKSKENKVVTADMLDADIQKVREVLGDLLKFSSPNSLDNLKKGNLPPLPF